MSVRNMLNAGAAWLASVLPTHAGTPIIYRRGNHAVALCATRGRTLRGTERKGAVITWTDCDFLVDVLHLVLAGTPTLPMAGDVVRDHEGQRYEVMPLDGGPCWQWSGPGRKLIRIHTKAITPAED